MGAGPHFPDFERFPILNYEEGLLDLLERPFNAEIWVQSVRTMFYFQAQGPFVLFFVSRRQQVKLRPELLLGPLKVPEISAWSSAYQN